MAKTESIKNTNDNSKNLVDIQSLSDEEIEALNMYRSLDEESRAKVNAQFNISINK